MELLVYIIFFTLGLTFGSFLNAFEWRLSTRQKITECSKCQACQAPIRWYDNIPVVSFLILRKKCRNCNSQISWQYPAVELWMGLAFVYILHTWHPLNFGITFPIYFFILDVLRQVIIVWAFTFIFLYDLKYMRVSDRVTLGAVILVFLLNTVLGTVGLLDMVLGTFIGGSFFLVQHLISRGKWVGDGDIRIGILMGVVLGWKLLLLALWIAYIIGAIIGVGLLVTKKKGLKSEVPFGVFLSVATIIVLVWGVRISEWYVGLISL